MVDISSSHEEVIMTMLICALRCSDETPLITMIFLNRALFADKNGCLSPDGTNANKLAEDGYLICMKITPKANEYLMTDLLEVRVDGCFPFVNVGSIMKVAQLF